MALFQYRVIDADGKEIHGALDAPDIDAAEETLHSLHPTVLSVTEAVRLRRSDAVASEEPSLQATFAFEGSDREGRTHRGTIDAPSKRAAFDAIQRDRGLRLNMLSPLGFTPKFEDDDLRRWQQETPSEKPSLAVPTSKGKMKLLEQYHPLLQTLTLYCSWLVAWYIGFAALGYYAHERELPFSLPFVEGFYLSSLTWNTIIALLLFLGASALLEHLRQPLLKMTLGIGTVGSFLLLQHIIS